MASCQALAPSPLRLPVFDFETIRNLEVDLTPSKQNRRLQLRSHLVFLHGFHVNKRTMMIYYQLFNVHSNFLFKSYYQAIFGSLAGLAQSAADHIFR